MYINAFFITDITITIVTSELPHYQLVDQTFTAASIFFLAIKSINASSDRESAISSCSYKGLFALPNIKHF